MGKIEVEDLTEGKEGTVEVTDLLFEETMIKNTTMAYIPILISDFLQAKLSTKEIIYVVFLMGNCLKELILEMGQIKEEDLADVDEWTKTRGKEYVEVLKTDGTLDRIKETYAKMTEKLKKS